MQTAAPTAPAAALDLGQIGIWSFGLRFQPPAESAAAAAELAMLGFKTVWIPGAADNAVLQDVDRLLDAAPELTIATGILNIWRYEPAEVAAWWKAEPAERQARVLLGLGVSHAQLIGEAYQTPLAKMKSFVDGVLAAGMAPERLCLAALGPKMLQLAGERTAGAHPYLVNPAHTALARKAMGPDALVAPEQGVVLERDPAKARELARAALAPYRRLPNYVNNWRRLGFSEDEVATLGDRLVDEIFAWGDIAAIGARVKAHLDAGADHVCLQVATGPVTESDFGREREAWEELATLL